MIDAYDGLENIERKYFARSHRFRHTAAAEATHQISYNAERKAVSRETYRYLEGSALREIEYSANFVQPSYETKPLIREAQP